MGTEDPALVFIPEGLGRPTAEVLDALIYALWESWFAPGDARIRGAIAAAQWLGQVRRHGPVSGEDRAPVRLAVVNEHDLALAVVFGLPHANREVDARMAQGVADMLAFAMGTTDNIPVPLVHRHLPPSAA